MTPPLSRYRVLDLTRVRSGPTAVRQFADWGADIVMIEPVQNSEIGIGGRMRSDFQNLNRNKRSLALDLKSARGKEVLLRLARQADLLFENFRPDVKHRLGIDYETLHAVNPRLVYVSISGFGEDGPYSLRPGVDQIAQGLGGLMSVTGLPGQGPVRAGIAIADSAAGLYAAIGAMTALLEREATGLGRHVTTSLLQAQVALMDFQAARWLVEGEIPEQTGNGHPTMAPMGLFKTADGAINIAPLGSGMFGSLCDALGLQRLKADPRFAEDKRIANRDELNREIEAVILTRTSAEWVDLLNARGIPSGPIHRMNEVFADPQVQHLHMAVPVDKPHPRLGGLTLVGQPFAMSGVPSGIRAPAPEQGEHSREILSSYGFAEAEIDALIAENIVATG